MSDSDRNFFADQGQTQSIFVARYMLARIGSATLVLWAAFTLTFLLLYILPGDPVTLMLARSGEASAIDPAQLAHLRAEYNLDKPLVMQYFISLGKALTLDLGASIQDGRPVLQVITQAFPPTLILAISALLLSISIGLLLALAASLTHRPGLREFLSSLPAVGISLPSFWVSLLLLQLFSFRLAWFPAASDQGLKSLVLPTVALAIPTAAVIAQVLSRSIAQTKQQPFVQALKAKGMSHLRLHLTHVLHNSAIPLLSIGGVIVENLLGGAIVIETVFSRQGIGRIVLSAVETQDIPLVQGLVLLAAAVYISINLLTDLLYPLVDPRIRIRRAS